MTNNTQPQLPAEVLECIITWVTTFTLAYHKSKNKDISNDAAEYITDELNMPNPLTEYAIKLHTARTILKKVYDLNLMPSTTPIIEQIKQFLDGTK